MRPKRTFEECCECGEYTGKSGFDEDSLYCESCGAGPFCESCFDIHETDCAATVQPEGEDGE